MFLSFLTVWYNISSYAFLGLKKRDLFLYQAKLENLSQIRLSSNVLLAKERIHILNKKVTIKIRDLKGKDNGQ